MCICLANTGPTNSGKTYNALQALKTCETGLYCGPLRLLALEAYDTLNAAGGKHPVNQPDLPKSVQPGMMRLQVLIDHHACAGDLQELSK